MLDMENGVLHSITSMEARPQGPCTLLSRLYSTPRLAAFCAGPIRTKIWDDLIRNAEPIADSGSLFAEHVQVAHALSVSETSKRSWFWEPEVIGKHVWKVSPRADLHTTAVG